MSHKHRRRDTLAGNISQDKQNILIVIADNVAVVAADNSGRLVVVSDLPTVNFLAGLWQQSSLDPSGQLKIVFQRSLFVWRQVVNTQASQRVCNQSFSFYWVLTDVANPVGSVIHPL